LTDLNILQELRSSNLNLFGLKVSNRFYTPKKPKLNDITDFVILHAYE